MFSDVLGCSEILSCSVRFLKVQKRSMTFWCDVRFSLGFWKIAEGSKIFFDVLLILRQSSMFSCVLSSTERFVYILRHPLTFLGWYEKFWGVHIRLRDCELLLKVQRRLLKFRGVLRSWFLELFWKVSESSEAFLDSLGCFWMLWGVLRRSLCSERFWNVSKGSESFTAFLRCCDFLRRCHGLYVLWKVFEFSQAFSWAFSTSERLLKVLGHCRRCCAAFYCIQRRPHGF